MRSLRLFVFTRVKACTATLCSEDSRRRPFVAVTAIVRAKSYVMTVMTLISNNLWLIHYDDKKNYLLDGSDLLRLVYGHSDGRVQAEEMRKCAASVED
jgi:hypothetical protein